VKMDPFASAKMFASKKVLENQMSSRRVLSAVRLNFVCHIICLKTQ
jgi:hypothetical protein